MRIARASAIALALSFATGAFAAPRRPTAVPADVTGLWLDTPPGRVRDDDRLDGRLKICPDGHATYTVADNQLIYEFTVRRNDLARPPKLEFYFLSGDHGRGFIHEPLAEPEPGIHVATAQQTSPTRLAFRYRATAFVQSVRRVIPADLGIHPFAAVFHLVDSGPGALLTCVD